MTNWCCQKYSRLRLLHCCCHTWAHRDYEVNLISILDFRVTDRHPHKAVLQYCEKTLWISVSLKQNGNLLTCIAPYINEHTRLICSLWMTTWQLCVSPQVTIQAWFSLLTFSRSSVTIYICMCVYVCVFAHVVHAEKCRQPWSSNCISPQPGRWVPASFCFFFSLLVYDKHTRVQKRNTRYCLS